MHWPYQFWGNVFFYNFLMIIWTMLWTMFWTKFWSTFFGNTFGWFFGWSFGVESIDNFLGVFWGFADIIFFNFQSCFNSKIFRIRGLLQLIQHQNPKVTYHHHWVYSKCVKKITTYYSELSHSLKIPAVTISSHKCWS